MIDGNRLPPLTKEEMLKHVREGRNISTSEGNRQSREAIRRTVQTNSERIERIRASRGQNTQSISRENEDNGSSERSQSGNVVNIGQNNGTATGSNDSFHQHVGGTGRATETRQPATGFTSRVKSVFSPYKKILENRARTSEKSKKAPIERGKRLSDTEIIKLRPKLIVTILWTSIHLDEFIIATTKGHDRDIEIWSNLDNDEAEVLADFMLSRGKQSPVAAEYVRRAVELMDRLKLLVIVAPRMYRTLMIYLTRGISIYT